MSDIPKIVLDRLRVATPGEDHPDADVLTAFAEQALSGIERETVVRHLARCGDCREVVALSIPPSEESAVLPRAVESETAVRNVSGRPRSWLAWPNLRWVAVAASVVVVGSVLFLHPGRETESNLGTEKLAAHNAPASPLEADTNSAVASSTPLVRLQPEASLAKRDTGSHAVSENGVRAKAPIGGARIRTAPTTIPLTGRQIHGLVELRPGVVAGANTAAPAPTPSAGPAERPMMMSETVEVTAAAPAINTSSASVSEVAPSNGAALGGVAGKDVQSLPVNGRNFNELNIVKAKPASKKQKDSGQTEGKLQDNDADKKSAFDSANSAFVLQRQAMKRSKDAIAQWSLAEGKLRRSLDSGMTWQAALQLDHPLLSFGVSAGGSDVWAGGKSGTLFHTSDNGATWAMVQPSTKAGALSGDIIAIEVPSATEVMLTTSNHESWSTADAGKTWDKK